MAHIEESPVSFVEMCESADLNELGIALRHQLWEIEVAMVKSNYSEACMLEVEQFARIVSRGIRAFCRRAGGKAWRCYLLGRYDAKQDRLIDEGRKIMRERNLMAVANDVNVRRVASILINGGPTTQSELAKKLLWSEEMVDEILTKMEKVGMVARTRTLGARAVELTSKGYVCRDC